MASFQPSKILIFGGTGQIGKYILNAIVKAQPPFEQVAIFTSKDTVARKADYVNSLRQKGVKIITGDVGSDQDIKAAYEGIDTVVSAVGRNALETQTELIRLAEESGSVQWFFPSEYGTDVEYWAKSATEKPHQLKLKVRKYARENTQRVKVTYLVTGPYIDMYFGLYPTRPEAGGFDAGQKKAILVGDGNTKIGFTTMPDVGKALLACLRHPEASRGKAIKVQSFVVTPQQILDEFQKQTGGGKWDVSYSSLQELRDAENKAWDEGRADATLFTLRRIWSEGATIYEKTDNESIGLKDSELETLEEAVHRALTSGW